MIKFFDNDGRELQKKTMVENIDKLNILIKGSIKSGLPDVFSWSAENTDILIDFSKLEMIVGGKTSLFVVLTL